ncbi:MAG: hypothetical protein ACJ74Z_13885 [Bryobacteraceae bacterium]
MATRREVIRFEAEPIKVKLDKDPHAGIECRGQYGIDWRYSVNDGKGVMYLPAEAREALFESGAAAGEEVAIRRLGKARWEAERIAPDLPFPSQPEAGHGEERDQPARPASDSRRLPERLFARPEPQVASEPPSSAEPIAVPGVAVTAASQQASQHMMSCYCVAIEVAVEVQEYARRKGINIAFTGSDIRAMGITVYIGDNQRLREAS